MAKRKQDFKTTLFLEIQKRGLADVLSDIQSLVNTAPMEFEDDTAANVADHLSSNIRMIIRSNRVKAKLPQF